MGSQRPSLRLRLTLGSPMVMAPILTPMEATEPMAMDTLMPMLTTERGLLMLSPRPLPRLILPSSIAPMAPTTHTPTLVSTVDMPDTDTLTMVTTTAMVSGPTTATVWDTEDTLDTTVWATEPSGDRFSPPEVESRSSKRTSLLVI